MVWNYWRSDDGTDGKDIADEFIGDEIVVSVDKLDFGVADNSGDADDSDDDDKNSLIYKSQNNKYALWVS